VNEILLADGTKLTLGKKPASGIGPKARVIASAVVMRLTKHPSSAAVAVKSNAPAGEASHFPRTSAKSCRSSASAAA